MKKVFYWVIIFAFLITNGCIVKKSNVINEDSKVNNFIVYNIGRMPEDLQLLNGRKLRESDLLISLFEGLVKTDLQGNVIPAMAESWEISKDGLTYNFRLREDAKWSNGEKVTAEDFIEFFLSLLKVKGDNIYAQDLYCIFGALEYSKEKKAINTVALKAKDSKELQIRLNYPNDNFLRILSQPAFTLRKVDSKLLKWQENYKNIVFTGPFVVDSISSEGEVCLVKNTNYYDEKEVKSDKIYITTIESSEKSLASFNNSNINVFINPPIGESKNLIINGEGEEIPINSGSSLNFNLKKKGNISTSGVNFRKALNSAIDRNEVAESYLSGLVRSASAYVPFESKVGNITLNREKFFKDSSNYPLAKELLQKSQYNPKERLKLVYLNNSDNKKICEGIAKDVKEAIGVIINPVAANENSYAEMLKNGLYDLIKVDYSLSYNDSSSLLESWLSSSQLNIYGYTNKDYDNAILSSKYERDTAKREELLKKAEEILINDLPMIPLYFNNMILCKKSNVAGLYTTKEGNIKLDRAYIEK